VNIRKLALILVSYPVIEYALKKATSPAKCEASLIADEISAYQACKSLGDHSVHHRPERRIQPLAEIRAAFAVAAARGRHAEPSSFCPLISPCEQNERRMS
jgi:hypothetical protein